MLFFCPYKAAQGLIRPLRALSSRALDLAESLGQNHKAKVRALDKARAVLAEALAEALEKALARALTKAL